MGHPFKRKEKPASDPKPVVPIPISEQKCWKCERQLRAGDRAVAHRHDPVAWCWDCAGQQESGREDLVKAVVVGG